MKRDRKEYQKAYYHKTKGRARSINRAARKVASAKWAASHQKEIRYRNVKYQSKKSGREFTLTIEQFSSGCNSNCHYCGTFMVVGGLDRIDSLKGYIPENVVPCCTMCNMMKRHHPVDRFLERVRLIAAHNAKTT